MHNLTPLTIPAQCERSVWTAGIYGLDLRRPVFGQLSISLRPHMCSTKCLISKIGKGTSHLCTPSWVASLEISSNSSAVIIHTLDRDVAAINER